jgi:predicted O-methyltransferase YrrM
VDVLKWMYEKKFVFSLEDKIITEVKKAGGEEIWGIVGRTNFLLLYSLVRAFRPKIIVETGVSSGSSSYVMLQALEKNREGILFSIDFPDAWSEIQKATKKESGWIVPDSLRYWWRLHLGRSRDLLPGLLSQLKEIDIFFHDSEHTYENMWFEYNLAWGYIKKNGLLLSHDVNWNSAFFDFCEMKSIKPIVLHGNLGLIFKK